MIKTNRRYSILFFGIAAILGLQLMSQHPKVKQQQRYGMWPSPIQAEMIAQNVKRFGSIEMDNGVIYWQESRPSEGGRTVIVSEKGDETPQGFSACTHVHEYGGKAFTVHNGTIYFVNDTDQRIYKQHKDSVVPLTQKGMRFADLLFSDQGLIAVGEIHHEDSNKVDNFLALIDLSTGEHRTLASGDDFYSSPCLSPDGTKLAYLSWNLPNMPWDGTQLWVADFIQGHLKNARRIAGGDAESLFQPQWGPDGSLYCISDKTGWWNLYRFTDDVLEPLCDKAAEFGLPQWVFGLSTYGFIEDKILCTYFDSGISTLALLDPLSKQLTPLSLDGTYFSQIRGYNEHAAYLKGSALFSPAVVKLDLPSLQETILASNTSIAIDPGYLSIAEPVSFPSAHGRIAHGFYYPPTNAQYTGIKNERPPLIVKIHGGPTSHATGTFSWANQFWTSRGFAILDVNYGGSTGYGRPYRDSLNGQWGIVDVEDCEYGAQYLINKGYVDPQKIAITGGSAGGYTALAALTFRNVFTVGAVYFGVSDPVLLAKETHKFESRYLDRLIGPYPERSDLYQARSPIDHVDSLHKPVIFFQGLDDKVVPPDQSEMMYKALKQRDIDTELVEYAGEKHGFKKAETIVDSLNRELAFYLHVFYGTSAKK